MEVTETQALRTPTSSLVLVLTGCPYSCSFQVGKLKSEGTRTKVKSIELRFEPRTSVPSFLSL